MKLFGEGGIPNPLAIWGELKSSISSLKIIPVDRDMTLDPKLEKESLIFNEWFKSQKTKTNILDVYMSVVC